MKKFRKFAFALATASMLLVTGCSSGSEVSEPRPGEKPVPPVASSPTLEVTIPGAEVIFDDPTFWSKTNCDAGIKNCDDEIFSLSSDNRTSNGKQLNKELYGVYKEATLYSSLKTASPNKTENCGSTVIGVTVPEWNDKTVFFCEYDNVQDDQMRTLAMKVIDEAL